MKIVQSGGLSLPVRMTRKKGDSSMKILKILAAGLVLVFAPQVAPAQSSPAAKASEAVKITEARKANAVLMRQYSWHTRTELMDQGAVKDIRIELINYGPDGQMQRTLLNDQGSPLPRGFLRRKIAENEREKMEEYLRGLRSLLDQYTLPTVGKVLDFMMQAKTTGPDSYGFLQMTGNGVILPGDTLSIWSSAATRQTSKVAVTTFYQGDVVEVTAMFKTLASGLTHVNYAEVTIPAKQLSVQVQNFNYVRNAPAVQKAEKKPPPGPRAVPPSKGGTSLPTIEQKLRDLKTLLDKGLITQNDYDAKKAQILENL
jgi:hypothetical protein